MDDKGCNSSAKHTEKREMKRYDIPHNCKNLPPVKWLRTHDLCEGPTIPKGTRLAGRCCCTLLYTAHEVRVEEHIYEKSALWKNNKITGCSKPYFHGKDMQFD